MADEVINKAVWKIENGEARPTCTIKAPNGTEKTFTDFVIVGFDRHCTGLVDIHTRSYTSVVNLLKAAYQLQDAVNDIIASDTLTPKEKELIARTIFSRAISKQGTSHEVFENMFGGN